MNAEQDLAVDSPSAARAKLSTPPKNAIQRSVFRGLAAINENRFGTACLLLSALPIAFAVWFVQGFSLVMPRLDEWAVFELSSRLISGQLDPRELVLPHAHLHIALIPRFILITLAVVTDWSLRAEIYAGLCLVAFTAFMLYRAFKESASVSRETRYLVTLFTVALLFSPAQDFLWTWGPGVFHYSENACIATAVWALARKRPSIGIAVASAVGATFTRFEGMFSWLVFFPALLAATSHLERRRRALLLWGAAGALSCAIVIGLIVYRRAPELSQLSQARDLAIAPRLKMAVSLIGMPAGLFTESGGLAPTQAYWLAGVAVLVALVVASTRLLVSSSDLRSKALPWIGLAVFGLAFALATAAVRQEVHKGLRLHVSCYSVTASLVAVATLHLVALALAEYRPPFGLSAPFWRRAAAALGLGVLILNYARAFPRLSARRSEGHWDRYNVELAHYFRVQKDRKSWFKFPEMAPALERAGFGKPKKELRFDEGASFGRIEGVAAGTEPLNGLSVAVVTGWAALPDEDAGTVVLAFGNERRFKMSATQILPRDGGVHWIAKLSWSAADTDPRPLRAWAYDRRAGCFRRLEGEARLEPVAAQ